MRGTRCLGWALLILTLSLPALGAAESPRDFMKEKQSELTSLVKKGGSAKKIEGVFDGLLDYDALARASLRDHWEGRTDAERREFMGILKQLVQRAYRKNLDRTVDYDVRFEGETREADRFVVRTTAQSKVNAREEPISIDYVVKKVGDAWRVQDIVTEGSSLVQNYQQQFNRVIKKDGFPELLRRMKTKLESGG
jgi:phospholipid transport system substrate-binding protein